ncbi:SusD/RagB family nutrient-binding outer membrane lipoprotein [Flavobacterium sp.]|uniref:SusD/RagB family nutrient-binding outer membrane lipoprotein n=1 Tax=Flavobacterium sp. TaxID=239 RepID=UPI0031DFD62B
MKKIIISILILSTAFIGCSTNLDINEDPDLLTPEKTPLATQLPAGIIGVVGAEGGIFSIIGGFWAQHFTQSSSANQFRNIDSYNITTNDYNYAWTTMYDGLNDIKAVQRKALAEENWNYYLIATTLYVQASQIMTDFYGDIPYVEACDPKILAPKFNTGQEVYDLMIKDLNNALAKDLKTSKGTVPGKDDFIFLGNMTNWRKFANTLKLKIYIRQSEKNTAVSDSGIKALLNDANVSFLDTDAAESNFLGTPNYENPLYEFNYKLNVRTNIRISRTLGQFLTDKADPRKDAFIYWTPAIANSTAYVFQDQGNYETNPSLGYPKGVTTTYIPSVIYNGAKKPVYLLSLEESLLLQAEALERTGASGKAKYDAAITENFRKNGISSTAADSFINGVYAYPASGTFDQKLEAIIVQKWVASFPENGFEAFFEKNRTDYPKTSPVAQNVSSYVGGQFAFSASPDVVVSYGTFPKRIPYPLSERSYNSNTPKLLDASVKIWWNK